MTDNQVREIMDKLTKCVSGIQRIETEQKTIKGDIIEMKGDIVEMKGDIVEMKGDIVEMKGDIVEMKGDIVEMKGDIVELKTGQKSVEKKLDIIARSITEIAGENVQIRARVSILEEHIL